jgi:hypothetical protein
MKIILHNHQHNGDILFTMEIVRNIIKSNPEHDFILIPSCASFLYFDILKMDNVCIKEHPIIWFKENNLNNLENVNEYQDIIHFLDLLWVYHKGDLYLNMWKILITNMINCIEISDRINYIKLLFEEINYSTNILLNFNISNYKDLIPILPNIEIAEYEDLINNLFLLNNNKEKIFFYNLMACSGSHELSNLFNNEFIIKLLNENIDALIIIPKTCGIKNKNLICLEDDLNILPSHDALNLVIYSAISNICNKVYFKINGGSLFILNRTNISNKNVKYYCLNAPSFKKTIIETYGLNCIWI